MINDKSSLMKLDALRQRCIEKADLVNLLPPNLDAVSLIKEMNEQRNIMIDYILELEDFIKRYAQGQGIRSFDTHEERSTEMEK